MQDANNDYYNEDIVSAERVNFNREGVTVIDGEIYSVTEDGILRMDCFYDQQIKEKKQESEDILKQYQEMIALYKRRIEEILR